MGKPTGPAKGGGEPGATGALRWLAASAVAYVLLHHLGGALAPLGSVGVTRWADWIDLGTPYAVLLPAAVALARSGAGWRLWPLYFVGALTYTEGHGIHLAANSVGNVAPGRTAHLWDEVVGHYAWYGGTALVFVALAAAFARYHPPGHIGAHILAALVGLTHATNSLEGGTAVFGVVIAAVFTGWGWTMRARLGRLLLVAYLPALLVLAGYGLVHGGFPQPSSL